MSNDVYIYGVGMIKFGKYLDRSVKVLTGEALEVVLRDCGLERKDIQAAWFGNSFWGIFSFQHGIRGQVALSANGVEGVPVTNVENACATGSCAFHGAWTAVKAGLYDCALAIGTEKIYNEDRGKMMLSFASGSDVDDWGKTSEKFKATEIKRESGAEGDRGGGKKSHSPGMDMYASGARVHMQKYGSTQRQMAVIAAKAHNNSELNPFAQYTFPMTVEQVLQDREVAYPLTRAMCAPVGDGSAAAILVSERFLREHPSQRAVRVRASVLRSGKRTGGGDTTERATRAAYETAGLGPEDVNVLEVHDATAFGELAVTEELGMCPRGEGGVLAESGATQITGKTPINTSGGLIARGHPLGASGIAQLTELTTQLRSEAGKRQVQNSPRIALAENGGGFLGEGAAAMCIHILEKT
jgi:acetyl-CoA acetyltransferase